MRGTFLALLLLAACGTGSPEAPPAGPSFRDRGVPMGSSLRAGLSDLSGDWEIAQSFPGAGFAAPSTHLRVEPGGAGADLRFEGPGGVRDLSVGMPVPGRLRAEDGTELWLLWLDDDLRTAAVGTPDGAFGWIMHRPGQASADREAAAREVLAWSGYDLGRLVGP